jgi:hypothetical protein
MGEEPMEQYTWGLLSRYKLEQAEERDKDGSI